MQIILILLSVIHLEFLYVGEKSLLTFFQLFIHEMRFAYKV